MIKNTKNLSFTFSSKALLFGRPDRSLLRDTRVLLSLGFFTSKTDCYCLPVILSSKEKNYINFKNFTYTKLNSLTVLEYRTPKTYYLFFKELIYSILYTFTFQEKNL